MKPIKLAGLNALLALALLGAACTPAAAPTPTLDPNVLYTAAAQTVIAQLTRDAPPPTATLAPTITMVPTKMSSMPTIPPLGTLSPLKPSTQQAGAGGDKCEYYSQTPGDGTSVKTGSSFNVTWKIKNVGTTTWGTGYMWRFYSASNKLGTSQSGYDMSATTAPNAIADITVQANAGNSAGAYDTTWVLTNPQGTNFCSFNVKINVTESSSASEPTAKPAAEYKMITYDENDINTRFGAGWTSGTITHTDGDAYQARVIYRTESGYTGEIVATGNNGVEQKATMISTSTGSGTLYFGITHGIAYTFKIDRPADQRVYQVDVCTTNVACW